MAATGDKNRKIVPYRESNKNSLKQIAALLFSPLRDTFDAQKNNLKKRDIMKTKIHRISAVTCSFMVAMFYFQLSAIAVVDSVTVKE